MATVTAFDSERERHAFVSRAAQVSAMMHSGGLFATPGFMRGAGRLLDLGGRMNAYLYNYSPTPEEADAWALYRDWLAIGEDMRGVIFDDDLVALQPAPGPLARRK